jgi:hypothetical protein
MESSSPKKKYDTGPCKRQTKKEKNLAQSIEPTNKISYMLKVGQTEQMKKLLE